MKAKKVIVLEKETSEWLDFLNDFFEGTRVDLHWVQTATEFSEAFGGSILPDVVFLNPSLSSISINQKLKALKQSSDTFRLFQLKGSDGGEVHHLSFDAQFDLPDNFLDFQRILLPLLPLPSSIKVLICDDEPDIGGALRDYLDHRSDPVFEVEYVDNGKKGLDAIDKRKPDVLILDVKMPVMTGIEVFRELKKRNADIGIVLFFDAVSGAEVSEIHKIGNPVIVDKGSEQSSMREMMVLIKKMAYFG